MSERSIILYAHEVRRLLDAGEAQIWRPIKPQPYYEPGAVGELQKRNGVITHVCGAISLKELVRCCCPYQPGERRWVKEKFQIYDVCYDDWTGGYEAGYSLAIIPKEKPAYRVGISYATDGGFEGPWRSAAHMPRWASRLTVEILDVEARWVQEIIEKEAIEAGITAEWRDVDGNFIYGPGGRFGFGLKGQANMATKAFAILWDFRYARRGCEWDKNPWTWVMKVRRVNV